MDRISTKGQMIDQIDLRGVPHSGFDRSNHNYGTGKLGCLIPVRLDEVYPGDRIKGQPEVVSNFEPLVAPLMGSMVLKQESFFIPYIQLWRHGWKFFTGKNGFAENMPSVSPIRIFDVYKEYVLDPLLSWDEGALAYDILNTLSLLRDNLSGTFQDQKYSFFGRGVTLYNDIKGHLDRYYHAVLQNVYGSRKMLDLVLPMYKILERFLQSDYLSKLSADLENDDIARSTRAQEVLDFSKEFGSVLRDVFNFFFGPSSLFDYLGWPVPVDLKLYSVETGDKMSDNLFEWVCFHQILIFGSSDTFYSELDPLFSQVELVFNPFKAYYLVWYWYYRDQLLETGILDPEDDEFLGSTITDNIILYCTLMRQRCWFKDTFTTALTNTGDGNLLVPTIDIVGSTVFSFYDDDGNLINTSDATQAYNSGASVFSFTNGSITYRMPLNYLHGAQQEDYSSVSSGSSSFISLDMIDRVRRLRSFIQKKLVLGYEVDDVVYSSFLVTMSDVRHHVPELLGRGRDAVQMNVLVNNTSTDQQIAGDRTAMAYAHGKQSEMNYFSEDWGVFLTFMTIMPIQSYAGGMQRLYLKRDVFDYMWPEFATMGMDAVYNCELAAIGTRLSDADGLRVFGYQGRYYDLKTRLDEEHGRLLTDLNFLTFSREWSKDNPPKLNYMFVHCWPRLDGFVLASPDVDVFRYDCYNAHAWERRLPVPSEIVG